MIAAIIQARMGSTRLPGKVLRQVAGQPLLAHLFARLDRATSLGACVVATTMSSADDSIEELCQRRSIPVFRGSESDVLGRYRDAARVVNASVIVRLTADCPLLDPGVVDHVVQTFLANSADFASNSLPPRPFPDGMDVEVMSRETLETAAAEATESAEREHVTFYMWMHPERFRISRVQAERDFAGLRLTVDYPEDLEVVSAILTEEERTGPMSMDQIIEFIERHPTIRTKNTGMVRNAAWPRRYREAIGTHLRTGREDEAAHHQV